MFKSILQYILILVVVVIGRFVSPGFAEPVHVANVQLELLSDVSAIASRETFWVGVEMVMDDGWHTYWKNSGDSGMGTKIKWHLPEGFTAGEIHWPYPKRFDYTEELTSYGHDGKIILLTEMTAPENLKEGDQLPIDAEVSFLSCKKICVPGKVDLSMTLPVQSHSAVDEEARLLFAQEEKRWPMSASPWQVTASEKGDSFVLNITTNQAVSPKIQKIALFPYRNDIIDHSAKQVFNRGDNSYVLTVPKSTLLNEEVKRFDGVLISRDGWFNDGQGHAIYVDIPVIH